MTPKAIIIGGQSLLVDADTNTLLAKDPNLVPTKDFDCPTLNIADDLTGHAPVTTGLNFAPTILLVIADGAFQWSGGNGGSALAQGVGPSYAANVGGLPYAFPCTGGMPKFCRSTNGGAAINLYIKILGA